MDADGINIEALNDPDTHEEFAREAYYAERAEEAAADREHDLEEASYFCLAWECLSDESRRPYRTTAMVVCQIVAKALV